MSSLIWVILYCISSIVCMPFIDELMKEYKDQYKLYYLLVFIGGFLWPLWLVGYCYGWIINR